MVGYGFFFPPFLEEGFFFSGPWLWEGGGGEMNGLLYWGFFGGDGKGKGRVMCNCDVDLPSLFVKKCKV